MLRLAVQRAQAPDKIDGVPPVDTAEHSPQDHGMDANANLSDTTPALLAEELCDARQRTLDLIADLDDDQLLGPRLSIVNPLLWEIGHLAWFAEHWILRHAGQQPPLRDDADALYDSSAVPHATRWDLPLPSRSATLEYLREVQERVLDVLERGPSPRDIYFIRLAIFHEDMHGEAFFYTRQTLGYPRPSLIHRFARNDESTPLPHGRGSDADVVVSGGTFVLGAAPDEPFVFDNEKWAHPMTLRPFAIARSPVTQAAFAVFVEDDGYRRPELWSAAGWQWRQTAGAEQPLYWQRQGHGWVRRDFDRWLPLEPHRPVIHVNWYEAEAYCRWAGRRLPSEAEWEAAASSNPDLGGPKRRFPWGDAPPDAALAQLDGYGLGCCDVAALAAGDSACGCRQMIGNVWEWTADDFGPYPGFMPDPYREYSQPWFATHKVLRGGAWTTRARLLRNTFRNFYKPDRRDVWAGFRTCALET
jgi:iron(II)-dependent oxidoreductase